MSEPVYPMMVFPASEEEGGGFVAYAPDLPGCISFGDTPQEALTDLTGAVGEWIDEALRLGRDVPAPGSLGERITADRSKLQALVQSQDEMIKAQDNRLREIREELDRLREAVSAVMRVDYDLHDQPAYLVHVWRGVRSAPVLGSGRRLSRLHN